MSWKQWTAVLLAIGAGIVLQIPRAHMATNHEHGEHVPTSTQPTGSPTEPGPYKTVDLEVTGMT